MPSYNSTAGQPICNKLVQLLQTRTTAACASLQNLLVGHDTGTAGDTSIILVAGQSAHAAQPQPRNQSQKTGRHHIHDANTPYNTANPSGNQIMQRNQQTPAANCPLHSQTDYNQMVLMLTIPQHSDTVTTLRVASAHSASWQSGTLCM